jgi:hypothetical protein
MFRVFPRRGKTHGDAFTRLSRGLRFVPEELGRPSFGTSERFRYPKNPISIVDRAGGFSSDMSGRLETLFAAAVLAVGLAP